ncbi:hydrogen peroxide-inducible genes activator [Erythrobacteraceae bacterium CFH 75059]|uniref:hydrogen peroxide-inducible genes activator n=1 Tax=Qipengyuania thermophila TaxID=2509361 RepID=UPI001020E696|nr:hydrogen peroxide-inducible genes activator [Qipengyuania thermophila]TCD05040.1 hydrogen peroxide-inducible genes activator [Erythrobacteraceae bacterium CFH 75059]
MATYQPTLKQLQYLVALSEHLHFGRAAEACFVSQSTLSAGIRELESLLGVTLVERSRRVVRFTPLGQNVVDKARLILRAADELTDMVQAAGKPLVGALRMAVIPTIAPFLLPRVLPRLRRERPDLKLLLREETSDTALDHLQNGRVDCVLLALPYAIGEAQHEIIAQDRLLVAYGRDHPDIPADSVVPDAIEQGHLLMLEDGHCLTEHALAACNRPELRASAAMIATSLHTLVQMVNNDLGVTMLPQMAIDAGILDGTDVVARPLESPRAVREIALVWRKNSPREADFRLLAAELRTG